MKPTCQLTEMFKVGDKGFMDFMGCADEVEVIDVRVRLYKVLKKRSSGYNSDRYVYIGYLFRTKAELAKHEIEKWRKNIEKSESDTADWEQYL